LDWVKDFYSKQNEWFGVYLGAVDESHHKRAWLIQELAELRSSVKVLELGAGGGQTAAAIANLGHEVTMVELLPESVSCAEQLAEKVQNGSLKVVLGDFYETDFEPQFDVICYFDSFGIGSDADQQRLLRRIASWLKPDGLVIIEVGATWYWAKSDGIEMDLGAGMRRYEFDPIGCRLIDKWWLPDKPDEVYSQSLRCYTPADFNLLLQGTGLYLDSLKPGGKVDYEILEFIEKAELPEAMTYYTKLKKG